MSRAGYSPQTFGLSIEGVFGRPAAPDGVRVNAEFQELQEDPAEKALWVKSLREARAMSVHTAVRTVQPDLDEKDAEEEVQRIMAEDSMADPATVGRGPETPTRSFN